MSETVTFEYSSLQSVKIIALDRDGYVYSRLANAEGQNEYKIRFWLEGNRREEWFYEFELTPHKEGQ